MVQFLGMVTCGNLTDIPSKFPRITSDIFLLIEIAIPVLLVIMGMIDLFKGITAEKEEEMIKGRKMFAKRLVAGVLVFFIFALVKIAVTFFDNKSTSGNLIKCMDCFVNNVCK